MTPQAFTAKWRDNPLSERAGAQAHFEDLCALLEVAPPRIEGEYHYERGLFKKSSASQGWADVWRKNGFAWEDMAPDKVLGATLKQLMVCALALDNSPEWVEWVHIPEEEQAGRPLRPVANPGHETELKKRTLTNLYNARPAWLDHAHRELNDAVAAAYGWTDYTPAIPDEEILRRLLALNLERAKTEHRLEIGRKIMKERHAVLRTLAE